MEINIAGNKAKEMIEAIYPFVNDYVIKEDNIVTEENQKIGRAKQLALLNAFELSSAIERITPKVVNFDTEQFIDACKKEQEFIEKLKEEIEKYSG